MFEQPRQQMRKRDDARSGSDHENRDDGNIELPDSVHDILVFAQQQQNESSRDAGENHGADGDGAREHHEPPVVRRFGGRCDGDTPRRDSPDDERQHGPPVPAADLFGDEQCRSHDQSEEKRPDGNGVVRKQIGHQPRQREDRNGDAQQHGQQEAAVDMAPELGQTEAEQQPESRGIDAADRIEQLLVNT